MTSTVFRLLLQIPARLLSPLMLCSSAYINALFKIDHSINHFKGSYQVQKIRKEILLRAEGGIVSPPWFLRWKDVTM